MIDPHKRPVLGDETLRLRAPVLADVDARLALGVHPEIVKMFGTIVAPETAYSKSLAEAWVDSQPKTPLAFIIEHDGNLAGAVRLHSVDMHDQRCNLAIGLLDPAFLGRGIGSRAMELIVNHAFGELGLNRITVRVLDYNTRAIAAYTKLGFVVEGRERQAARVGDVYHDDIIMGLLASEWRPC
ncbi:GNAT family N-acetyltransferase [Octadecabacter sp.]|nr:GNAT family N-acetyltransferase [Octadecabacter sp.]